MPAPAHIQPRTDIRISQARQAVSKPNCAAHPDGVPSARQLPIDPRQDRLPGPGTGRGLVSQSRRKDAPSQRTQCGTRVRCATSVLPVPETLVRAFPVGLRGSLSAVFADRPFSGGLADRTRHRLPLHTAPRRLRPATGSPPGTRRRGPLGHPLCHPTARRVRNGDLRRHSALRPSRPASTTRHDPRSPFVRKEQPRLHRPHRAAGYELLGVLLPTPPCPSKGERLGPS